MGEPGLLARVQWEEARAPEESWGTVGGAPLAVLEKELLLRAAKGAGGPSSGQAGTGFGGELAAGAQVEAAEARAAAEQREAVVREAVATCKVEVDEGLSQRGRRGREEVDAGVPDMCAVAEVQGAELGGVAQQEAQGGIGQLQARQAQLRHPLQPASALGLPWFGVWGREEQFPELGVFDILDPAEVQESQGWQWGRTQGRDGEPGAAGEHQLLQAL